MHGRLLTLVGPVLLVAMPAAAQAPDPFDTKVRALAHPRYAEREKAVRELEAAGEPALKALRAALARPDEELRARAALVAARIERAVLSKRLLVAPTLALKLDRVPLEKAVHEVARKTGLPVQFEPAKGTDRNRTVTLDTGEVPFWQAVQAFYEAAGLTEADGPAAAQPATRFEMGGRQMATVYMSTQALLPNRLRLANGDTPSPAATGQALRVRALAPDYEQNRYDAEKEEVTFHLAVDNAPTLTVQEIVGVEVRRATTGADRTLAPRYPPPPGAPGLGLEYLAAGQQILILDGGLQVPGQHDSPYFPVTLKVDGPRPRRLAELEGIVVARVLAPPEALVRVPDVFGKGKGQVYSGDGLSCQVTKVEEVAENPLPAPRVRGGFGDPAPAPAEESPAAIRIRVVTSAAVANEVLNFPVQVRGRLRPFVRINRRSGPIPANLPGLELRDGNGKAVRLLSTRMTSSSFDGSNQTQELVLTFVKPDAGLEGLSLTLSGRRSVVVEMPFTLKDVPLP
jgi:hypothetical protein